MKLAKRKLIPYLQQIKEDLRDIDKSYMTTMEKNKMTEVKKGITNIQLLFRHHPEVKAVIADLTTEDIEIIRESR